MNERKRFDASNRERRTTYRHDYGDGDDNNKLLLNAIIRFNFHHVQP